MIEWFLAAVLITSVWAFWVVPIVFFFIVLAFAENEKNFFAGVSVVIFAALMYHSGFLILTDPWLIAKYFGYYFGMGAVWSIAKWYLFGREKAENFKTLKEKYIKKMNIRNEPEQQMVVSYKTVLPEEVIKNFKAFIVDKLHLSYYHSPMDLEQMSIADIVIPSAQDHKEKITTWILWWPTSAFWTILNDPLVKLANAIYDRFQGIYGRISNMVFKDVGL